MCIYDLDQGISVSSKVENQSFLVTVVPDIVPPKTFDLHEIDGFSGFIIRFVITVNTYNIK